MRAAAVGHRRPGGTAGRLGHSPDACPRPAEPDTNPIRAHLNATPKYVVTKTLTSLEWAGSHVLAGDVAASVNDLKQHGNGTIAVLGSGVLVQTLIEHDIVDEYRLFVHPLVLGAGKRLFRATPRPIPLRLAGCTPTTTGVLLLSYQPQPR